MAIEGKKPIPDLGDTDVVDDTLKSPRADDFSMQVPPGRTTAGGFPAAGMGFGSGPAAGGFGSAPSSGFGGGFAVGPATQSPSQPYNPTAAAATNAASDADVLVKHSKESEDWINKKWRPVMGWLYMATCAFDFIVFPILWSITQALMKHPITQWDPLTLKGAGLYHIAMGAVLGIAAYGRTKEKLESKN